MRVRTGTEGGNAVLEVVNSGPVVPADEIGRLCQPFQRMDPDRVTTNGGLGLGLSIVAAIASAHGATLEVAGPAAGGLHVRVTFRQTVQ
jgi:signal transduction histidine kinase